jgi:hypothetical protein
MSATLETALWLTLFGIGSASSLAFVAWLLRPRIPDNTQDMIDNCEMQQPIAVTKITRHGTETEI